MSSVRVVGITKPVDFDSPENLISYCARVSNPENQMNFETSGKLLSYCIRNNHWSVFEMVNVVFEIQTTRDIGRQILRHRSFSAQEFSTRYSVVESSMEYREARLQDPKDRQNSVETDDPELIDKWTEYQRKIADLSTEAYKWALDGGIAKEQARVVLPEGMTPSTMYMNGTLRSWIHYVDLRTTKGTQKEHREIAEKIENELKKNFGFLEYYWA